MKKILISTFIGLFLSSYQSFSIVRTITVSDFSFSPADITVNVGDVVKWVWANGSHTTTSTNIPNGANAWNSNINSTKTTFEYTVTVAGTYNYKCVPHESMGMVGSFTAVSTTGIAIKESNGIHIFPNPFTDFVYIKSDDLIGSVEIFDLTGKNLIFDRIKQYNVGDSKEIDLSSLKQGIYFVVINTERKKMTFKILKK